MLGVEPGLGRVESEEGLVERCVVRAEGGAVEVAAQFGEDLGPLIGVVELGLGDVVDGLGLGGDGTGGLDQAVAGEAVGDGGRGLAGGFDAQGGGGDFDDLVLQGVETGGFGVEDVNDSVVVVGYGDVHGSLRCRASGGNSCAARRRGAARFPVAVGSRADRGAEGAGAPVRCARQEARSRRSSGSAARRCVEGGGRGGDRGRCRADRR